MGAGATGRTQEKRPGTPASRTWLISRVASAGLEPAPDTAVRCKEFCYISCRIDITVFLDFTICPDRIGFDKTESLVKMFVWFTKNQGVRLYDFQDCFGPSLRSLKDHKSAYRINADVTRDHT